MTGFSSQVLSFAFPTAGVAQQSRNRNRIRQKDGEKYIAGSQDGRTQRQETSNFTPKLQRNSKLQTSNQNRRRVRDKGREEAPEIFGLPYGGGQPPVFGPGSIHR
jgi:hypothetical protein